MVRRNKPHGILYLVACWVRKVGSSRLRNDVFSLESHIPYSFRDLFMGIDIVQMLIKAFPTAFVHRKNAGRVALELWPSRTCATFVQFTRMLFQTLIQPESTLKITFLGFVHLKILSHYFELFALVTFGQNADASILDELHLLEV